MSSSRSAGTAPASAAAATAPPAFSRSARQKARPRLRLPRTDSPALRRNRRGNDLPPPVIQIVRQCARPMALPRRSRRRGASLSHTGLRLEHSRMSPGAADFAPGRVSISGSLGHKDLFRRILKAMSVQCRRRVVQRVRRQINCVHSLKFLWLGMGNALGQLQVGRFCSRMATLQFAFLGSLRSCRGRSNTDREDWPAKQGLQSHQAPELPYASGFGPGLRSAAGF